MIDVLPMHDGNSSITTTVSISDGDLSNNVPVEGQLPNEEVNQIQPHDGEPDLNQNNFHGLGLGMYNIMSAYPEDEELEPPVAAANVDLLANINLEEPLIAAVHLAVAATAISDVAVQLTVMSECEPVVVPEGIHVEGSAVAVLKDVDKHESYS